MLPWWVKCIISTRSTIIENWSEHTHWIECCWESGKRTCSVLSIPYAKRSSITACHIICLWCSVLFPLTLSRIKIGLPSNGRNTRLNIINQIMPLIHWTFKVAENQMSLQKMKNIFKDPQSRDKTYSKIIRLYKHWTMEIYLHDIWKKSNAG